MRRKYMSHEEHEAYAKRIRAAIREMADVCADLVRIYGCSSRIGKIAERLFMSGKRSDLQELRSRLDDAWFNEGHERTYANPYYGEEEAQQAAERVSTVH